MLHCIKGYGSKRNFVWMFSDSEDYVVRFTVSGCQIFHDRSNTESWRVGTDSISSLSAVLGTRSFPPRTVHRQDFVAGVQATRLARLLLGLWQTTPRRLPGQQGQVATTERLFEGQGGSLSPLPLNRRQMRPFRGRFEHLYTMTFSIAYLSFKVIGKSMANMAAILKFKMAATKGRFRVGS